MIKPTKTFKQVKVGESFRFDSEIHFPLSGMKTGEAVKISTRKYQYKHDGMICTVGSINTGVIL